MPVPPRSVVPLLAAMLLAGCGGEDGSSARPDPDALTSLTITFEGPEASRAFTLTCAPIGGTWNDRDGLCARLATPAGRATLAPIERETRDLGPITRVALTVGGRVDGEEVRIGIPREGSSTRKARHRELVELLGPAEVAAITRELGA